MATGAVLTNLDGLVFNKAFLYGTRHPESGAGTTDAIGFGAVQNVRLTHEFAFAELSGPESLSPLGVGVQSETLSGSFECGVVTPEQFIMAMGGTMSYDGGTDKTTYTKRVEEEPAPFDLHYKSAANSPDLEVYLYRCLAPSWNIVSADNRAFMLGGGSFRVYGEANGGKLFDVIKPGNLTTSS